jgi:ubiquinone/menaquinone biosynthesis C-methylase UbiE
MKRAAISAILFAAVCAAVTAQEKSVRPGITDPFPNPDVEKFAKTFEGESREVFTQRQKVLEACKLKPGMVVADIGAGTGLYTRLFAKAVGADGQVYAVDIAPKFLEHIQKTCRATGMRNVTPVLCNPDSVDLPPNSIDVAFICDTYHHFEFPEKTMLSLDRALKPGGRIILIDFHRIPGKSSDWVLGHVRAGQETVEKEIASCGFKKTDEVKELLKENYLVVFTKPARGGKPQ